MKEVPNGHKEESRQEKKEVTHKRASAFFVVVESKPVQKPGLFFALLPRPTLELKFSEN
jgi:hypothetical protein